MFNLKNIAEEFISKFVESDILKCKDNEEMVNLINLSDIPNDFIAYIENPDNGYRKYLFCMDRKSKAFYIRYCNKSYYELGYDYYIVRFKDSRFKLIANILISTVLNKYSFV
jgi:hypothetical protein